MVNSIPPEFFRWVAGDLTGNRMRSLYAEWLLARRLGVLNSDSTRVEWDIADIRFGDILIEVKTSGMMQQWSVAPTAPRFSIAPQKNCLGLCEKRYEEIAETGKDITSLRVLSASI